MDPQTLALLGQAGPIAIVVIIALDRILGHVFTHMKATRARNEEAMKIQAKLIAEAVAEINKEAIKELKEDIQKVRLQRKRHHEESIKSINLLRKQIGEDSLPIIFEDSVIDTEDM